MHEDVEILSAQFVLAQKVIEEYFLEMAAERFGLIKHIKVIWFFEDEIYAYESIAGSILANSKSESIRFELRELYGDDDNFQVIIQKVADFYEIQSGL